VQKVDPFAWRRVPEGEHTAVEVSDLELTISMADLDPWRAWYESDVLEGKVNRLDGRIELLAVNQTDTLASLDLVEVGIVSLTLPPTDGDTGTSAGFKVVLSVESVALNFENSDL